MYTVLNHICNGEKAFFLWWIIKELLDETADYVMNIRMAVEGVEV